MTRRFVDFVREIEGKLTDDERRELDAWREHFRDGGDGSLGMREPAKPKPSPLLDEHYASEAYRG